MHRFDRTEAQPKPVTVVRARESKDRRPVVIQRNASGKVEFYCAKTGLQLHKVEAVAMMVAYKARQRGEAVHAAAEPRKQRKQRVERPWLVALYRTDFATKRSELIAEEHAATWLAAASKLASLCMQHVSDKHSAVEVLIEQK